MISPPKLTIILINYVTGLIEAFLGLRIILKLFGASTVAPFVRWVYETTEALITPFEGMFPAPKLSGIFVVEFSALFALMVYAFVGYLAIELIETLAYYGTRRTKNHRNNR